MRILIVKDDATRIPREVAGIEEALAVEAQGFTVLEELEDGSALPLRRPEPEPEPVAAEEAAESTDLPPIEAPDAPPAEEA